MSLVPTTRARDTPCPMQLSALFSIFELAYLKSTMCFSTHPNHNLINEPMNQSIQFNPILIPLENQDNANVANI